jgi:dTDP-4-amino-4,6-dideoxygalactose transaminase
MAQTTTDQTSAPVPFVDLDPMHAEVATEIESAIAATVERGDFILGAELDRFEEDFAAYCGVRHAIGVGSGTAALQIAVLALGLERGSEIVVPAHTYIASALGPLHAGLVPVPCEVDERTGLIDPAAAEAAITDRTAAILAVHLYGQVCDPGPLRALASARGLALIEDAAQAHGAEFGAERAGSIGDVAAFSFYPSKNLGAFGDGGCVTTNDDDVAALARQWRNLGQRGKNEHVVAGVNERLDTLQAAVLRVKLRRLDAWNAARREAADIYRRHLAGTGIAALPDRDDARSVFHLFPVLVAERDRVGSELAAQGIGTGVHYPQALHQQPPFASTAAGAFPVAERWARDELSLPMFPGLPAAAIERVVAALLSAARP